MSTTELIQCACPNCTCEITDENRVIANEAEFCSEACATGHATQSGCCNDTCQCG